MATKQSVLSSISFGCGIAMIFYDFAGHACCWIARRIPWAAELWNQHSTKIWPSNPVETGDYDAYWSRFFAAAMLLLVLGYALKGRQSETRPKNEPASSASACC